MEDVSQSPFSNVIIKNFKNLIRKIVSTNKKNSMINFTTLFRRISIKLLLNLTGTLMQSIVSLITLVIYVMSTYYDEDSSSDPNDLEVIQRINLIEIFIAFWITFFYITNFMLNERKLAYFFNLLNIIDIITIFPVYMKLFLGNRIDLSFTKIFRLFRLARASRIFKILKNLPSEGAKSNRTKTSLKIIAAISYILFFVFITAGILHYLNNNFEDFNYQIPSANMFRCTDQSNFNNSLLEIDRNNINFLLDCSDENIDYKIENFTFDTAFYYLVITITTVGYGDVLPMTTYSRFLTSVILILGIIIISVNNDFVSEIFKTNNEEQIPYNPTAKHIIIIGSFRPYNLKKYLNEIFHNDNKKKTKNFEEMKIIVVQPDNDPNDLDIIINNEIYDNQVYLVKGEITQKKVLNYINMKYCDTVFILSDPFSNIPLKNDHFIVMISHILSHFSKPKIYAQFNFSKSLEYNFVPYDHGFSTKKLKNMVMLKNGFVNGISTIIMNLVSDSTSLILQEKDKLNWFLEYIAGACQIISFVKVDKQHVGKQFRDIVKCTYFSTNLLIIGIKREFLYNDCLEINLKKTGILINPVDYALQETDELVVLLNDNDVNKHRVTCSENNVMEELKNITENKEIYSLLRDEMVYNDSISLGNNLKRLKSISNMKYKKIKKQRNLNLLNDEFKRNYMLAIENGDLNNKLRIWDKSIKTIENMLNKHFMIVSNEDELGEFMPLFKEICSNGIILFLSVNDPSNKWNNFSKNFSNLYYVQMKNFDKKEFKKLKIHIASHIYFFSSKIEGNSLYFSQILPTIKMLEENFKDLRITIEVPDEINFKTLSNSQYYPSKNYKSIFSEEYQHFPLRVCPEFTRSEVFITSFLDSILPYTYFNPYTLEVIQRLLKVDKVKYDEYLLENNDLCLLKYIGKEKIFYGELVYMIHNLLDQIIPLAIYRINCSEELKNVHRYVVTNPSYNTYMSNGDEIICIGKTGYFEAGIVEEFNKENNSLFSEEDAEIDEEFNKEKEDKKEEKRMLSLNDIEFFNKCMDELKKLRKTRNKIDNRLKVFEKNSDELNLIDTTNFSRNDSNNSNDLNTDKNEKVLFEQKINISCTNKLNNIQSYRYEQKEEISKRNSDLQLLPLICTNRIDNKNTLRTERSKQIPLRANTYLQLNEGVKENEISERSKQIHMERIPSEQIPLGGNRLVQMMEEIKDYNITGRSKPISLEQIPMEQIPKGGNTYVQFLEKNKENEIDSLPLTYSNRINIKNTIRTERSKHNTMRGNTYVQLDEEIKEEEIDSILITKI